MSTTTTATTPVCATCATDGPYAPVPKPRRYALFGYWVQCHRCKAEVHTSECSYAEVPSPTREPLDFLAHLQPFIGPMVPYVGHQNSPNNH